MKMSGTEGLHQMPLSLWEARSWATSVLNNTPKGADERKGLGFPSFSFVALLLVSRKVIETLV